MSLVHNFTSTTPFRSAFPTAALINIGSYSFHPWGSFVVNEWRIAIYLIVCMRDILVGAMLGRFSEWYYVRTMWCCHFAVNVTATIAVSVPVTVTIAVVVACVGMSVSFMNEYTVEA